MNSLSPKQNKIHKEIVHSLAQYQKLEWKIIELLQRAEEFRLPRAFELRSLFEYATRIVKLDEARAYSLITLARKSKAVPELAIALCENKISASKASRIVSVMDQTNASELIQFASSHSKREVEFEVARRNPRAVIEKAKPVSEDRVEVTISLSKAEYEELLRVQALEAHRDPKRSLGQTVATAVHAYLFYRDPVKKAERAMQRKNAELDKSGPQHFAELCPGRVEKKSIVLGDRPARLQQTPFSRKPLTAAQRHAAHFMGRGKCTHIFPDGSRCGQDRYVELHHIVEVSRGGSNHSNNLSSLCRFHHQMLHRRANTLPTFEEWIEQCAPTEVSL